MARNGALAHGGETGRTPAEMRDEQAGKERKPGRGGGPWTC